MTILLGILTVLAMAGVLGVLFAGILGVSRAGGEENARRSNRLMRWRVMLQALALLLFILLLYSLRS
jgi:hypothetical protein